MRVLGACSLGGAGHLRPLLPVLDAARRRGAHTLIAGPPSIATDVEHEGFRFASCGEPPTDLVTRIRARLPTAPADVASVLANRELFGRHATAAMLPALERLVTDWSPEIVVRDPCEYASAVIGHRDGIPTAQVAIGLADVEWGSIDVASPALEAHRAGLTDAVRGTPYLSRYPASLDPSPFPDTRRFRETSEPPEPLPDWWDGSAAPLVHVSFGTVLGQMPMAATAYRIVLAAVGELDVRVLLSVGRHFDVDQLGDVPANTRVESWVRPVDVLAEADVVVCHGGSGTTFGALAAGLPVVIAPMFADQFANAAMVADAGAGVVVATEADGGGSRRPLCWADVASLTEAIETARQDRSHREAARRIANEMAAAPSIDEVLAGWTTT